MTAAAPSGAGPLRGLCVVEMAGLGPVPFAAMLLADLGAEVIRIDRPLRKPLSYDPGRELVNRGRRSVAIDLAAPGGAETVLRLIERADALLEGFRPRVMERLGLGPDACLACNERLVYGRMTGWGREGPLAETAGHDIGYVALTGALDAFRRPGEQPTIPLNFVGDYAGGGMLLAFGVLAGLWEAGRSGTGQVVDASMLDGVAALSTVVFAEIAQGRWDPDGANFLQSAAPWYDSYETADGRYIAVGALENRFYRQLLELMGLSADDDLPQWDRSRWPELKERFAKVFSTRTRSEWAELFATADSCGAPVLSFAEAPQHPHHQARGTFVERDGMTQPAPAPRFSRTPAALGHPPVGPGADSAEVLADWGFSAAEITALVERGVVVVASAQGTP